MAKPLIYKIVGVSHGKEARQQRGGAPTESWMIEWGRGRGVDFVIRYFPSRKGWRVLDIRNAKPIDLGGSWKTRRVKAYRGQARGMRYWGSEDAAIMAALSGLDSYVS
jgi:hypothetical protein